jgi:16S rRNA (cytosine1407-C5)-methyltransferase
MVGPAFHGSPVRDHAAWRPARPAVFLNTLTQAITQAMTPPARRSFRVTALPEHAARVRDLLAAQGFAFEPEPFSPLAWRLVHEPMPLGRSLAAFFGCVYIQDRASMLPPLLLAPQPGDMALDLCASPGSKTGLLAQLTGNRGLALGNEPNSVRLTTLRRNLQQLNLFQTATCCYPGQRLPLPDASWRLILLDPPCSGWGAANRHPGVLRLWQGDKVLPLIRLQQALLREAARLLRPGGRLIYSTCTTNAAENEAQARFAGDRLGLVLQPLAPPPGFACRAPALPGVDGVLRVDEDASQSQGFFLAGFTAPGRQEPAPETPPESLAAPWTPLPPERLAEAGLDPALLPPGEAGVFGEAVYILPRPALDFLPRSLRWQGMTLGKFSGGLLRPAGGLRALATGEAGPARVDIDDIAALCSLIEGRSLNLGLPGRLARLFWRDLPLGLLAVKSGRAMLSVRQRPDALKLP